MRRNISIANTPAEDKKRETPSLMMSREEVIAEFYSDLMKRNAGYWKNERMAAVGKS